MSHWANFEADYDVDLNEDGLLNEEIMSHINAQIAFSGPNEADEESDAAEEHGFGRDLRVSQNYLASINMLPSEGLNVPPIVLVEVGISLIGVKGRFSNPPSIRWRSDPVLAIITGCVFTSDDPDAGSVNVEESDVCIAFHFQGGYYIMQSEQQATQLLSEDKQCLEVLFMRFRLFPSLMSALINAVPNMAPETI